METLVASRRVCFVSIAQIASYANVLTGSSRNPSSPKKSTMAFWHSTFLYVRQHIQYLKAVKKLLGTFPQNIILLTFKCCFQKMPTTSLPPTPPGKTTFKLEPM